MARTIASFLVGAMLCAQYAAADIADSNPVGFTVRSTALVRAPAIRVYDALASGIGHWWDPAHTWSGNSGNLSMNVSPGGCFCERLEGGGSVVHAMVVYAEPGRALRLHGALGPLQESGVSGSLTWTVTQTDAGTQIDQTYSVGGYWKGGLATLAPVVDGVMAGQLERLRRYVETGRADAQ